MKNPFIEIAEAERLKTVDAWVAEGVVESKPCGWDLLTYEDEWGIYTLGQVRRFAAVAGIRLHIPTIDLDHLLQSDVVTEAMEDDWITGVHDLDDVYMGLILEYLETTQQGGGHVR